MGAADGLGDDLVDDAERVQVFRRDLERLGGLLPGEVAALLDELSASCRHGGALTDVCVSAESRRLGREVSR